MSISTEHGAVNCSSTDLRSPGFPMPKTARANIWPSSIVKMAALLQYTSIGKTSAWPIGARYVICGRRKILAHSRAAIRSTSAGTLPVCIGFNNGTVLLPVTRRDFLSTVSASAALPAALARDSSHARWEMWYRQPATRWLDALPVGNGRLGAMVFGAVAKERIALNESTVWSGSPNASNVNPSARE